MYSLVVSLYFYNTRSSPISYEVTWLYSTSLHIFTWSVHRQHRDREKPHTPKRAAPQNIKMYYYWYQLRCKIDAPFEKIWQENDQYET